MDDIHEVAGLHGPRTLCEGVLERVVEAADANENARAIFLNGSGVIARRRPGQQQFEQAVYDVDHPLLLQLRPVCVGANAELTQWPMPH